jgi:Tfp pilus assembly protein PilF
MSGQNNELATKRVRNRTRHAVARSVPRFSRIKSTARIGLCLITVCLMTGCSRWSMWRNDELKNPTRLHLTYAQLSEKTGDVEKARDSYNNALQQDDKSVLAVLGLARLDLLADRPHQAEQGFLKAIQLAPNDSRVAEAAGQFYITQDRFKEASKYLLKGVQLNPDDKRLRHRLGLALARQGEIAAAEPHFIQAVGEAEADYNIGLILYEQGDIDSAERRFFQASLKKPQLAQAQHWLDTVRQERANQQNMANRQRQATPQQGVAQNAQLSNIPQAPQPILQNRIAQTNRVSPQDVPPQNGVVNPPSVVNSLSGLQNLSNSPTGPPPNQTPQNRVPNNTPRLGGQPSMPPPLNPSTMTATQLEQLENSMTPGERERFRLQMQNR